MKEKRERFRDLHSPRRDLPSFCKPTADNPDPELLFYGIPVPPGSVWGVIRRFCDWCSIDYPGDDIDTLNLAMKLLNDSCDVDFLTLHDPIVPYSGTSLWVITFYTNRNIGRGGLVDDAKEKAIVKQLRRHLRLPKRPPRLWFWADGDEDE